ncbi:MAG: hypothetical protein BWY70_02037 [Bacteroidetes bacterium ADurb.Bin408]|nr:MAG: hypothetical protein BWY70_02037 [Bacteroidetes bacterium ADurb.Bin408]
MSVLIPGTNLTATLNGDHWDIMWRHYVLASGMSSYEDCLQSFNAEYLNIQVDFVNAVNQEYKNGKIQGKLPYMRTNPKKP